MITYHPSYLLRREEEDGGGLKEKRLVWEDMLQVMEQLGLSISEKQRGYFTKAIAGRKKAEWPADPTLACVPVLPRDLPQ